MLFDKPDFNCEICYDEASEGHAQLDSVGGVSDD